MFAVDQAAPVLYFQVEELNQYLENLNLLLAPETFGATNPIHVLYDSTATQFNYVAAKLLAEVKARKQATKRHFGVHGYFTRQSWDVVQAYIKNFTKSGEIRKNNKFKTRIPLQVRIRYYLISYMRQCELQKHHPTFDDIVLNIMPLLQNGTTPEHQTILSILKDNAVRVGEDQWKLDSAGQKEMFEKEIEH